MEAQLRVVTFSDALILDLTYLSNSISHSTIPLSSACPGLFSFCTITVRMCLPLPCFYGFIHLCIHVAINSFFLVSKQLFFYFSPRLRIKMILQPPTHSPVLPSQRSFQPALGSIPRRCLHPPPPTDYEALKGRGRVFLTFVYTCPSPPLFSESLAGFLEKETFKTFNECINLKIHCIAKTIKHWCI